MIDGKVIPENPNASPISKDIPAIQGATRTERTVYVIDSGGYGALSEAELRKNVAELVGEDQAEEVIAMYRKEKPDAKPYALDFYISTVCVGAK